MFTPELRFDLVILDLFELVTLKPILKVYLIPEMKSVQFEYCSFLSHNLYFHEFSSTPSGPRIENVNEIRNLQSPKYR